jgi:uncharacterized damage-inducible protein DinB
MNDYPRLFDYDQWANHEVLRTLQALQQPPQRSVKLIAHIVGTQFVWYARIMRTPSPVPVWPDWTLQQTTAPMAEIAEKWKELASRGERFLAAEISYANSKGENWVSRDDDVLMHVVMHGAYHRGQIAADVRASGNEPPYTDFIHPTRAGLLP